MAGAFQWFSRAPFSSGCLPIGNCSQPPPVPPPLPLSGKVGFPLSDLRPFALVLFRRDGFKIVEPCRQFRHHGAGQTKPQNAGVA